MRILFICKGTNNKAPSAIIRAQALSLEKKGMSVDIYSIKGRGPGAYMINLFLIQYYVLRNKKYDIIHAHYGLTGILTSMAIPHRRIIVSIMGSEIYHSRVMLFFTRFFAQHIWNKTIVKSTKMKQLLNCSKAVVIPNGVDLGIFTPMQRHESRRMIGVPEDEFLVLFPSNPARPEKNFRLAKEACQLVAQTKLLSVYQAPYEKMNLYYSAANVVLITSLYEGSPNAVKEALATNTPVVAVDVGDIAEYISDLEGCAVCPHDPIALSLAIAANKESKKNPDLRKTIHQRGLDSDSVCERLIQLYKEMLV